MIKSKKQLKRIDYIFKCFKVIVKRDSSYLIFRRPIRIYNTEKEGQTPLLLTLRDAKILYRTLGKILEDK